MVAQQLSAKQVDVDGLECRTGIEMTSHDHWVRIVGYPAVKRLRHLFASHLMGLHKPDLMIFRTLEQQLGYHAGEIIFFDDTPENVIAANGVGWRAHLIDSEADTAQQITAILREESALS